MKFVYHPFPTLPRLAWCAQVARGEQDIHVFHGPWVETRPSYFVEGAWDGPFEGGGFDEADTLVGSGGKTTHAGALFSCPTNIVQWLYSMRIGDHMLVSNSLVFLLVRAGDRPDLKYPYYYLDLVKCRRWGLAYHNDHIFSNAGRRIDLHKWDNFLVGGDLQISRVERGRPGRFSDFASYKKYMDTTVRGVFENAGDPERMVRYRPLAGVSSGYDSTTGAALAAQAGCREAFTFGDSSGPHEDSGVEIARHLGMDIAVYDRMGYLSLPGMPEAEFCATPSFGTGVTYASLEPRAEKSVLLTGYHGDIAWGLEPKLNMEDLLYPTGHQLTGASINEFRLRVGFFHFPVPYAGAIHKADLQRISESQEMSPWRGIGGYDRPIARRIIESAGVPGNLFGQTKLATGHTFLQKPEGMKKESREDYLAFFYSDRVRDQASKCKLPAREKLGLLFLDLLYGLSFRIPDKKMRVFKWLLPVTLHSDRMRRKNPALQYFYLFHWGFEKIKDRYTFVENE